MDLTPFFTPWFDSHLLPQVQISHDVETAQPGHRLRVRVTQTGNTFVFPLWIEWREDGRKVRRKIVVDKRALSIEIPTDGEPERIRFNPERAVPGRFVYK